MNFFGCLPKNREDKCGDPQPLVNNGTIDNKDKCGDQQPLVKNDTIDIKVVEHQKQELEEARLRITSLLEEAKLRKAPPAAVAELEEAKQQLKVEREAKQQLRVERDAWFAERDALCRDAEAAAKEKAKGEEAQRRVKELEAEQEDLRKELVEARQQRRSSAVAMNRGISDLSAKLEEAENQWTPHSKIREARRTMSDLQDKAAAELAPGSDEFSQQNPGSTSNHE